MRRGEMLTGKLYFFPHGTANPLEKLPASPRGEGRFQNVACAGPGNHTDLPSNGARRVGGCMHVGIQLTAPQSVDKSPKIARVVIQ